MVFSSLSADMERRMAGQDVTAATTGVKLVPPKVDIAVW